VVDHGRDHDAAELAQALWKTLHGDPQSMIANLPDIGSPDQTTRTQHQA
jgi:hypothetical protein